MDLRRAWIRAKEMGVMVHQTALRESSQLVDLAYELADSDTDDELAVSRLRSAFGSQKDRARSVAYCLDRLQNSRESRTGDRAFRLAQAAASGEPVEQVDSARVALWDRLKEMETMPVGRAYNALVALVPSLTGIVETAQPLPEDELQRLRWQAQQTQRISSVVGPDASHSDPLVKTFAMARLARDYLSIVAGDVSLGTVDSSHRDIERARLKEMSEREGYSVSALPGGRYSVTARTTFGAASDSD